MDFDTLVKQVASLSQRVAALENPVPYGTGPVSPVRPTPKYDFDPLTGRLHGGRDLGMVYIDPIVGPDCPRTVTLSETGHTLSIPRVDLGEMFMGYCMRVSDQAGGDYQIVGSLAQSASYYFASFGGFKPDGSNWPHAADRFFNGAAYGDSVGETVGVAVPEPAVTQEDPAPVVDANGEMPIL